MNIPTHMLTSAWAARWLGARHPLAVVAGSFFPDTYYTAIAIRVMASERRLPGPDDLDYFRPRTKRPDVYAHSLIPAGGTLLLAKAAGWTWLKEFAIGWLGHILVDVGMHHRDAAPPFAPLSPRVYHAPISGSEKERYAAWVVTGEVALCLLAGYGLLRK